MYESIARQKGGETPPYFLVSLISEVDETVLVRIVDTKMLIQVLSLLKTNRIRLTELIAAALLWRA